jgi:hypothetical protein
MHFQSKKVLQSKPFLVSELSNETDIKWKKGEINLWLTCYTFRVEILENEPDLSLLTDRTYKQ